MFNWLKKLFGKKSTPTTQQPPEFPYTRGEALAEAVRLSMDPKNKSTTFRIIVNNDGMARLLSGDNESKGINYDRSNGSSVIRVYDPPRTGSRALGKCLHCGAVTVPDIRVPADLVIPNEAIALAEQQKQAMLANNPEYSV